MFSFNFYEFQISFGHHFLIDNQQSFVRWMVFHVFSILFYLLFYTFTCHAVIWVISICFCFLFSFPLLFLCVVLRRSLHSLLGGCLGNVLCILSYYCRIFATLIHLTTDFIRIFDLHSFQIHICPSCYCVNLRFLLIPLHGWHWFT